MAKFPSLFYLVSLRLILFPLPLSVCVCACVFDSCYSSAQVIPAGVPRKPGMTRQDLFHVNATLNANFADAVHERQSAVQIFYSSTWVELY